MGFRSSRLDSSQGRVKWSFTQLKQLWTKTLRWISILIMIKVLLWIWLVWGVPASSVRVCILPIFRLRWVFSLYSWVECTNLGLVDCAICLCDSWMFMLGWAHLYVMLGPLLSMLGWARLYVRLGPLLCMLDWAHFYVGLGPLWWMLGWDHFYVGVGTYLW